MGNNQSVKKESTSNAIVEVPAKLETADGTLQMARMDRMYMEVKSLQERIDMLYALQIFEGKMDRMDMEVKSLQERIDMLYAEELQFEIRADEAISTFGNNVRVIMLIQGLGSIFLQLNYHYAGACVPVMIVVSFFSSLIVAFIVTYDQLDRMSEFEKKLWTRQVELQNELTYFGAKIGKTYSDKEFNTLAANGDLAGVLDKISSLNRHVAALQRTITGILELSSNSESKRMKSLFQVSVVAFIYGLCFPTMAYFFLNFVGFRRGGLVSSM